MCYQYRQCSHILHLKPGSNLQRQLTFTSQDIQDVLSIQTMLAHTAPQTGIEPTATAHFHTAKRFRFQLMKQTAALSMGPNNDSATLQSLDDVVASPELLSPVRSSLVIDRILTLQSLQTASKSAAVTWSR